MINIALLLAYIATPAGAQGQHLLTAPAYDDVSPYGGIPPSFEDRLIYYNSFDGDDGAAQINKLQASRLTKRDYADRGVRGRYAQARKGQYLQLKGRRLSPHLPLTIAFWWALGRDGKPESAFRLAHLTDGRGFISHFSRGKGKWCALKRPAGVLQVYHLKGIANVNAIYDRHLAGHIELKHGVWHHTALVISGASQVDAYTDGERVCRVHIRGRHFKASDKMNTLSVGSRWGLPMAIDELFVLRRALTGRQIGNYVTAVSQMEQVNYPL